MDALRATHSAHGELKRNAWRERGCRSQYNPQWLRGPSQPGARAGCASRGMVPRQSLVFHLKPTDHLPGKIGRAASNALPPEPPQRVAVKSRGVLVFPQQPKPLLNHVVHGRIATARNKMFGESL